MRLRFLMAALVLSALPLAAQQISTHASQPRTPVPGLSPDPFVFPNQPTVLFRPNFTVPSSFDDFQHGRVHVDGNVRIGGFRHHHRFRNAFGVVVPYAVPYYVVPGDYASDTEEQPVNETPQYSGNELDRQMLLQHIANSEKENSANDSRYGEHYLDSREPRTAVTPAPEPPAPPREEDMLVLVFRDGHQLTVANYAIVGDTFYDLTPGHKRMIKLSDLDLVKTKQLNDDRGVDFTPPKTS